MTTSKEVLPDQATIGDGAKWVKEERNNRIYVEAAFEPTEDEPEFRQVCICEMYGNEKVDHADAELICKAVNERQNLIDALVMAEKAMSDLCNAQPYYNDELKEIRQVINNAKNLQP